MGVKLHIAANQWWDSYMEKTMTAENPMGGKHDWFMWAGVVEKLEALKSQSGRGSTWNNAINACIAAVKAHAQPAVVSIEAGAREIARNYGHGNMAQDVLKRSRFWLDAEGCAAAWGLPYVE